MADDLKAHYDETFAERGGELYDPLSGLDLAAHNRRMDLLAEIDLPNLTNATVVDYGVGSWGFGCIFPRLKEGERLIGFDIAQGAIDRSAEVSASDSSLSDKGVEYHVSLGYSLAPLHDREVDVFFCGECIEHIEDTNAFLAEVYRVLKPGGIAIFTTPNGDPWIYRQLRLRWCVGFEHVALMGFDEFRQYLERFFEPVEYIGFNQSIMPALDGLVSEELGEPWVKACRFQPQDATSLIAVVRKASDVQLAASTVEITNWQDARVTGAMPEEMTLLGSAKGGMIRTGSGFWLDVPEGMTRGNIIMWSHPWSGYVRIRYKDEEIVKNLYSHAGGCERITLDSMDGGCLLIEPAGARDPRSNDNQIILYRVVFARGPSSVEHS